MQNNFLFACAVDKCECWGKWVITAAITNFYDTNFVIETQKDFSRELHCNIESFDLNEQNLHLDGFDISNVHK